ncbi:hypothetical protein, partial [Bilophila wadsworthia]|uniref:hypothetical protein n=1 Tax=Bilophila wadsworthia TaxID=35833 RepID=UPI003AB59A48
MKECTLVRDSKILIDGCQYPRKSSGDVRTGFKRFPLFALKSRGNAVEGDLPLLIFRKKNF